MSAGTVKKNIGAPRGPLAGLRILDLTRVLAGPFCTMILGDLGAEVIKVEDIDGGDQTRHIPPLVGGESHYFLAINRNKKSLTADPRTPGGKAVILDLVQHCDVLVENFRPGVMDRLGFGPAALRAINPRLIVCSISGYGQKTSLGTKASFDLVAQALSGVMSINGEPDAAPTKLGLPIGDLGGGVWAAIAVLAALQQRHATGQALTVDLSLVEGLLGLLGYLAECYLVTGEVPQRVGSSHQSVVPYGRFPTRDGHIVIALMVESFFVKFCAVVGRPDLARDERFSTPTARKQNRQLLEAFVATVLCDRTTAEWQTIFDAADIPAGPVNTVGEALDMPIVAERGMVQPVVHPSAGTIPLVRTPVRYVEAFNDVAMHPPPLLGEHSVEVLTTLLGYDAARVERLRQEGAIGPAPGTSSSSAGRPSGAPPQGSRP